MHCPRTRVNHNYRDEFPINSSAHLEIDNPRTRKQDADLQRELATKKSNCLKARRKLARHCTCTANRRKDFLLQQSARLVKSSTLEKLTVKNLTRAPQPKPDPDRPGEFLPNRIAAKSGLNREILDTAPATLPKLVKVKPKILELIL